MLDILGWNIHVCGYDVWQVIYISKWHVQTYKDKTQDLIKSGQKLYIKGDGSATAPVTITLHIENSANQKNGDPDEITG